MGHPVFVAAGLQGGVQSVQRGEVGDARPS